jgi:predicted ATPase
LEPSTGAATGAEVGRGGLFVPVLDLISDLAAEDAVAVAFEDLHWADTGTWDLFEFVARNLVDERVVVVGTYRANEISNHPAQRRRLAELTRLPVAHRVNLGGLDRGDVTTWVTALMGGPAPSALADEVLQRGQGNPFSTDELVAAHPSGEAVPVVLSDLISAKHR